MYKFDVKVGNYTGRHELRRRFTHAVTFYRDGAGGILSWHTREDLAVKAMKRQRGTFIGLNYSVEVVEINKEGSISETGYRNAKGFISVVTATEGN